MSVKICLILFQFKLMLFSTAALILREKKRDTLKFSSADVQVKTFLCKKS